MQFSLATQQIFSSLRIASAIQYDNCRIWIFPDGKNLKRVLFFDAPLRALPLALNDKTLRPLDRVKDDKVDPA